ncbi:MAG: hypothetical protein Q8S04_08125 [Bacteroidales bacterium]|nr:hypothetical protein [Bacteroidales bacterium]
MIYRFICSVLAIIAFCPLFSQMAGGGSVFYEKMRTLSFEQRETLIAEELIGRNMPRFITDFVPVTTNQRDASGKKRRVVIFVSVDYLSVGDEKDYFIIPMGPLTAQRVANSLDASLPTPKVVDIIYSSSKLKLEPFNFIPRGNRNETPDILYDHSKIIQAQIKAAGKKPGVFVAGTKKDIVISSKLTDPARTKHVTIYGWHKPDGKPIQPVTNVHINTYVDYSHGVRLISNRVIIDGKEYRYREILKDSLLHALLSYETAPFTIVSYLEKPN